MLAPAPTQCPAPPLWNREASHHTEVDLMSTTALTLTEAQLPLPTPMDLKVLVRTEAQPLLEAQATDPPLKWPPLT